MNKLVENRQSLGQLTLDELADYLASTGVSSQNSNTAQAEFLRRQTKAVMDTASATKWNSNYILVSVVVLALSSLLSAGATMYAAYYAAQTASVSLAAPVIQPAPSLQAAPTLQAAPILRSAPVPPLPVPPTPASAPAFKKNN